MNDSTYIRAQELEKRLADARVSFEQMDDNWDRSRALNAYDTAVEAATCFRDQGGDIWLMPTNPPQDDREVLIFYGCNYIRCMSVGWYEDGVWWTLEGDSHGREIGTVIAWCELPDEPDQDDFKWQRVDDDSEAKG